MGWASIIAVILNLLGPLVKQWLEDLLNRAAASTGVTPSANADTLAYQLEYVFDEAAKELWWFQFRKKAALNLARGVALRRSRELALRTAGGTNVLPHLTRAEQEALRDVAG